jgi:hypothetical protein
MHFWIGEEPVSKHSEISETWRAQRQLRWRGSMEFNLFRPFDLPFVTWPTQQGTDHRYADVLFGVKLTFTPQWLKVPNVRLSVQGLVSVVEMASKCRAIWNVVYAAVVSASC